jgi:hypothetical protein
VLFEPTGAVRVTRICPALFENAMLPTFTVVVPPTSIAAKNPQYPKVQTPAPLFMLEPQNQQHEKTPALVALMPVSIVTVVVALLPMYSLDVHQFPLGINDASEQVAKLENVFAPAIVCVPVVTIPSVVAPATGNRAAATVPVVRETASTASGKVAPTAGAFSA